MTFDELNLKKPILAALRQYGYTEPTPIQMQAIPPALEGRDLLGCAQTGTGKTAAFAIPILQRLSQSADKGNRRIRSLILTPTRELALQIFENFVSYGKNLSLRYNVVFGGVSQNPQTEKLRRGTDILIATPGRLLDLMQQGFIDLSALEVFVLDEADRMLDMGFIHDVRKVVAQLPQKRQTMLFSATMPTEIEHLADALLDNPAKVAVTPPATTVERIKQSVFLTDKVKKRDLLIWLLRNRSIYSALVFTRTKHGADRVARTLNAAKISAASIHGDKSQGARQMALASFKSGKIQVLVATDIAARGIDIDSLSHVINFDIPNEAETYVHRIGRTGRAGAEGVAMSFCDFDELAYLKDIEKLIKLKISVEEENPYPMSVFESAPKAARPQRKAFDASRAPKSAPRDRGRATSKGAGAPKAEAAAEKWDKGRGTAAKKRFGTGYKKPRQKWEER